MWDAETEYKLVIARVSFLKPRMIPLVLMSAMLSVTPVRSFAICEA